MFVSPVGEVLFSPRIQLLILFLFLLSNYQIQLSIILFFLDSGLLSQHPLLVKPHRLLLLHPLLLLERNQIIPVVFLEVVGITVHRFGQYFVEASVIDPPGLLYFLFAPSLNRTQSFLFVLNTSSITFQNRSISLFYRSVNCLCTSFFWLLMRCYLSMICASSILRALSFCLSWWSSSL